MKHNYGHPTVSIYYNCANYYRSCHNVKAKITNDSMQLHIWNNIANKEMFSRFLNCFSDSLFYRTSDLDINYRLHRTAIKGLYLTFNVHVLFVCHWYYSLLSIHVGDIMSSLIEVIVFWQSPMGVASGAEPVHFWPAPAPGFFFWPAPAPALVKK